jgi:hypothetical protein
LENLRFGLRRLQECPLSERKSREGDNDRIRIQDDAKEALGISSEVSNDASKTSGDSSEAWSDSMEGLIVVLRIYCAVSAAMNGAFLA